MRAVEDNSIVKPDKRFTKLCEEYVNEFSKMYLSHIDMSRQTLANHLETHLSFITAWNEHMRKFAYSYQKLNDGNQTFMGKIILPWSNWFARQPSRGMTLLSL